MSRGAWRVERGASVWLQYRLTEKCLESRESLYQVARPEHDARACSLIPWAGLHALRSTSGRATDQGVIRLACALAMEVHCLYPRACASASVIALTREAQSRQITLHAPPPSLLLPLRFVGAAGRGQHQIQILVSHVRPERAGAAVEEPQHQVGIELLGKRVA
jgi:hypothetical protein